MKGLRQGSGLGRFVSQKASVTTQGERVESSGQGAEPATSRVEVTAGPDGPVGGDGAALGGRMEGNGLASLFYQEAMQVTK